MMGNANKLPNVFNTDQLVALFDAFNEPKTAIASALALFCGLRIEEVCRLKVENIDLVGKRVKVVDSKNSNRGKHGYGKDRYVPVPDQIINPLKLWLEIIDRGKWFLPSETTPDRHMRTKTLGEKFRIALKEANLLIPMYNLEFTQRVNGKKIEKRCTRHRFTFHTLRHTYATYVYEKTKDIYVVSTLLGHNQVTTTQVYAKVSDDMRSKAVQLAFGRSLSGRVIFPQEQSRPLFDRELEMKRLEVEQRKLELAQMQFRDKLTCRAQEE